MTDDKKKGIPKKESELLTTAEDEVFDLDISSEKSLHRPLKIRVEGKVYISKLLSLDLFNTLTELQVKAEAGDEDSAFKQIDLVFGLKKKDLKGIDLRDVGVISELVGSAIRDSEQYRTEKEKKVEGPGEISSAS